MSPLTVWIRGMADLYQRYRQAVRNEKKAMRDLKQWMRENSR